MSQYLNLITQVLLESLPIQEAKSLISLLESKTDFILSNRPQLVQGVYQSLSTDSSVPEKIKTLSQEEAVKQLLSEWEKDVKGNLEWFCKQYIQGKFKNEDIKATIKDELFKFNKVKGQLPKQDLNQYTWEEYLQAINLIKSQNLQTSKEHIRQIKSEGVEELFNDGIWRVLWLKTKEAAIAYGKNTRWCTAGTEFNMFDVYNKKGKIYFVQNIKNPEERYQFHLESSQFMNVEDKPIKDFDPLFGQDSKLFDFFEKI